MATLPSCKFYFGLVSKLRVGVGVSAAVEKIGVDIEIYRARTDTAMVDNRYRSVHQAVVWWKVQVGLKE